MRNISFDRGKFSTLMSVLSIIKSSCKDLMIIDGFIYQLSNNRRCLYDIDLTPIIGNESIILSSIDLKYNLLDPFKKQQVNTVMLDIDEISEKNTKYYFKDVYSKLEFQKPSGKLNNRFENKDELSDKISIDEDNPLVSCEMKKFLLDRLYTYSKTLGAENLLIIFENNKVSFAIQMGDNNSSNLGNILTIDVSTGVEGMCSFVTPLFLLGTDEIFVDLYKSKKMNDAVVIKITTTVGEEPSVKIKVWSHSIIKPL